MSGRFVIGWDLLGVVGRSMFWSRVLLGESGGIYVLGWGLLGGNWGGVDFLTRIMVRKWEVGL